MVQDHYTCLGIEKEKFYGLDKQGKEELVDNRFEKLSKSLSSELFGVFSSGMAMQLKNARDILKDERVRKYYDFSLENGEKPNVDYDSLKNHLDNPDAFNDPIEKQQKKLDNIKSQLGNASYGTEDFKKLEAEASRTEKILEKLNKSRLVIEKINEEQIEQIKEKLEKIKTGKKGKEGDIIRNETVSKVTKHLESELKGLMENVLKIKTAKINDLDSKLKSTEDKDEYSKIKDEITKITNERSKLLKELNGLNSESEQSKKEVGQQAKPNDTKGVSNKTVNIPPTDDVQKFINQSRASKANGTELNNQSKQTPPPKLSVLNEQIEQTEGNLEMMKRSIVEEKKPDTLELKHEAVRGFEDQLKGLIDEATKLIKGKMDKVIKERKEIFQGVKGSEQWNKLTDESRKQWNELTDQLLGLNNERSRLDIKLDKSDYQPKLDVNNSTQGKFAQQVLQEKEASKQQKAMVG